jgi:sulfatase maturation enzyme AslB (radical SAM superfamily)
MFTNALSNRISLDPNKFQDPLITAKGEKRATVTLTKLRTLWFNTGSLCNITCVNCYMDSSPKNDDLAYLKLTEVIEYLDEIEAENFDVEEIAFTGGEPFMNPDLIAMLYQVMSRGFKTLVLTNAMKPMTHRRDALLDLKRQFGKALNFRVSMDHYSPAYHEKERGPRTWGPMIDGLRWLSVNGFNIAVAGRTCWGETDNQTRNGYATLFKKEGLLINPQIKSSLVLFPEMDSKSDVPEITTSCWEILNVVPEAMMCATSRMIVKRRGAEQAVIVPCTLLPYDTTFELGHKLAQSSKKIHLNHPHCAKFCVIGGASCSVD